MPPWVGQLREGVSVVEIIQRFHLLIQDVSSANPVFAAPTPTRPFRICLLWVIWCGSMVCPVLSEETQLRWYGYWPLSVTHRWIPMFSHRINRDNRNMSVGFFRRLTWCLCWLPKYSRWPFDGGHLFLFCLFALGLRLVNLYAMCYVAALGVTAHHFIQHGYIGFIIKLIIITIKYKGLLK